MIAIRKNNGEIVILNQTARIMSVRTEDGYEVIADVPVGGICNEVGCGAITEFLTLAEVADHEAAQRILAILWRYMEPGCRVDMAEVLKEAGA